MGILSGIALFVIVLYGIGFLFRIFGKLLGLVFSILGILFILYIINNFIPLDQLGVPMIVLAGIILAIRSVMR